MGGVVQVRRSFWSSATSGSLPEQVHRAAEGPVFPSRHLLVQRQPRPPSWPLVSFILFRLLPLAPLPIRWAKGSKEVGGNRTSARTQCSACTTSLDVGQQWAHVAVCPVSQDPVPVVLAVSQGQRQNPRL